MTEQEQVIMERAQQALAKLPLHQRVEGILAFLDGQTAKDILVILGTVTQFTLGYYEPKVQALFLNKLTEDLFGKPDPEKAV